MQLLHILQNKLIPWAEAGVAERIVVVRNRMTKAHLPRNVTLAQHKLFGERIIVKSGRQYGNTRLISAKWPAIGMIETENFRFICAIEGNVNYWVGNYEIGLSEGDFLLIPPKTPHPFEPKHIHSDRAGGSCQLLWMHAYRRGFQCWISHYERGQRIQPRTENYLLLNEQPLRIFELLIEEAYNRKEPTLCNGLMLTFMNSLLCEIKTGRYLHPGPIAKQEYLGDPQATNDISTQLKIYIGTHLSEHLTLESVARALYMSRTQLARRLRQETGRTFVEVLTAYRMQEAQMLLANSDWIVEAIAHFVGFRSVAYFHTLFKRQLQCTPLEFRQKSQKNTKNIKKITKKKPVGR